MQTLSSAYRCGSSDEPSGANSLCTPWNSLQHRHTTRMKEKREKKRRNIRTLAKGIIISIANDPHSLLSETKGKRHDPKGMIHPYPGNHSGGCVSFPAPGCSCDCTFERGGMWLPELTYSCSTIDHLIAPFAFCGEVRSVSCWSSSSSCPSCSRRAVPCHWIQHMGAAGSS